MKHKISDLMDGELFEDEAESLLGRVKSDPSIHQDWGIYHLIGDVLRQPEHIHHDLSVRVRDNLQDEPTILAPRRSPVNQKLRTYALSAAASLLAFGAVAWMSLQVNPEMSPNMAMQQANLPVKMQDKSQTRSNSSEYLMAHQEFSPSTGMNGGASYIRSVSYSQGDK